VTSVSLAASGYVDVDGLRLAQRLDSRSVSDCFACGSLSGNGLVSPGGVFAQGTGTATAEIVCC